MRGGEEDEESSQCSSGCQSGWTLYLEQSGSAGQHQRCTMPYQRRHTMLPQAEYSSDEEDSMVSDASSGPQVQGQTIQCKLLQPQLRRRRSFLEGDKCCDDDSSSGSGTGGRRNVIFSGSGNSFVSTRWSPDFGDVKSGKKTKAAVFKREEAAAIRRNAGVDDDDEDLHDSASSSAVACIDVVEAMHGGRDALYMDLQPSCAFSSEHSSPEWPAGGSKHGRSGLCDAAS